METQEPTVKVSVIVPVYNVARHLENCFQRLAAQTLQEWEAVCVDDGSKDDSLELLHQYARRDSRIVVLHQENAGVSAARNAALLHAKGKYVCFYDPDDVMEPRMLETLYEQAEAADSPFAISAYLTYSSTNPDERRYCPQFFYGLKNRGAMRVSPWMMVCCVPFIWVNLYNRRHLLDHKLTFAPLRVAEDVLFSLRVWLSAEKVAVCPEALYHYVRYEGSVMGNFARKPFPVYIYLKYYFEMGRLFRGLTRENTPGLAGKAAAAYVIMLREKGAAVTYKHYDPVHDYAWICRANRCLLGRLWKKANKVLVVLFLARIVLYKLMCRLHLA